MADKKKILILYGSAGHGHEKAARAVEAACRASGGHDVSCVDALAHTSFGFGARYRGFYIFMIRSIPWFWGFFYYFLDNPVVYAFVRPLRRLNNHVFAAGIERLLTENPPDILISTHFLGCEVAGHLKRKGRLGAKLVTVVTDYLAHAFWIVPGTDVYCVGSEETARDLEKRGVPRPKIRVTGIPIESKFSAPLSREALRTSLGLKPSEFTVLLTSGGGGVGLVEPLAECLLALEPALKLLAVCGTNKPLYERLSSKYEGKAGVRIFGFVDNVHELMAASDVVLGKGGGLTVTESLAMGKPMVLIGAVPGQETKNVRVVTANGAAGYARSAAQAAGLVGRYRSDRVFYQKTLDAIASMRRRGAADQVLRAALEL